MQKRIPSGCFFAIIFEGRTGSSYTTSALNNHPEILCYPEVLIYQNAAKQKHILNTLIQGSPIEEIAPDGFKRFYFQKDPANKHHLKAVGLKTTIYDLVHLTYFFTFLRHHNFQLIYLKRKNIIKSTVSLLNAERLRKKYRMTRSNALAPNEVQGPLHIQPEKFIRELKQRIESEQWHEEFFMAYDLPKRVFYYEDLLQDWDGYWSSLLGYLDVDYLPCKGHFFKNTPDRLCNAIQNYDEIRSLFDQTEFEPYFDE